MKESIAKTAILSSLITIVIILGLFLIFRGEIASYLQNYPVVAEFENKELSRSQEEPIITAVARVNDAVVSVVVTKDVPIYERYYEVVNPWGIFGGISIPRIRENGFEAEVVGGGSGFVVSADGLIVTNYHVVSDEAARYSVLLSDGTPYTVDVLASDPEMDIAILKISEELQSPLTEVVFGDSANLQLGQSVIAIGNALAEFQNSVSAGVISGLARSIQATDANGRLEQLHQIIQTDAAINPGNSGGPLLNLQGEVIGVNVATSRGADNIGFAIPSNIVSYTVSSVQQYGKIIKPYLGVRYVDITPYLAENSKLPVKYGAFVTAEVEGEDAVMTDSPAAISGIKEGDIIIALGGTSLEGKDLATVLRTREIQTPIVIEIIRDGEYLLLETSLISL